VTIKRSEAGHKENPTSTTKYGVLPQKHQPPRLLCCRTLEIASQEEIRNINSTSATNTAAVTDPAETMSAAGVRNAIPDSVLKDLKKTYADVAEKLDKAETDILYAQYDKEGKIVKLMIDLYQNAVIDDQKTLKQRQDAATAEAKWETIETELDSGGIKKELREKLDPAYTDIKIALQFGEKGILSNVETKTTGFQLPK